MDEFRFISYSASHICMVCYLLVFIKWRFPVVHTVISALFSTVLLILLEWMQRLGGVVVGTGQSWTIIAQILVVQGTALYLTEYRDFRGLFTGLTSSNYVMLGNLVAIAVYAAGAGTGISLGIGVGMHLLFLGVLAHYLRPPYLESQLANRQEWMGLCLIPSGFYLALLLLVASTDRGSLPRNLAALSLLLTQYLAYVIVFRLINSINREEEMQKEREMLETSIKALKLSVEEAYAAERRTAIQNHDRRHMIRTLQTLMVKQDYAAVEQLLSREEELPETPVASHYCDNLPVNGVITCYAGAAQRQAVQTYFALEIPEKLWVNEWELAVVVGNLMENAVEAAGQVPAVNDRKLWMTARQVRDQLLIEIRNTFDGDIQFDRKTALPQSSRGEGHGLGLRSVAHFAERAGAALDCGIEDGIFVVRLLI